MSEFLLDSFMGRTIYHLSGRRLFLHEEEKPGYVIPEKYLLTSKTANDTNEKTTRDVENPNEDIENPTSDNTLSKTKSNNSSDTTVASDSNEAVKEKDEKDGYIIVTFEENDKTNPYNWPFYWKAIMAFQIAFMTTSVYMGSAIYTPGILDIMNKFEIGQIVATLPLTLFVVGYGIGPIFFSPLSEDIRIGRTPLYIISIFIFCMMQIPTALSTNIAGLCILRFIAGFFASPCLSTGGASFGDLTFEKTVLKYPHSDIMDTSKQSFHMIKATWEV
ncbi:uncharacterized protein KGF55_000011 [Candida pseudojiufengensis]|uniref:uncharacterized protein n=1 Tax=Candida pseudojiufengensis TaxID=497109 RepID=UPI002224C491|nr:uncharacterized protein KGF55_000011 [Candida pseudojiufengensis]KAI5968164.1 hypothetical protein KGF55_000011 [Candida pseudojiufengensis]